MSCDDLQGGDPNHQTSDFAVHLTLEHRSAPSAGGGGSGGLVGAGFRGSSRGGGGGPSAAKPSVAAGARPLSPLPAISLC